MIFTHQVFVYGTLMRGNRIRGMDQMEGAQFVGSATTTHCDYSLWDLGAFPAVSLGGHNCVQGEVWRVTDSVLDLLDDIEGYPVFYTRSEIQTTHGTAWIYHIPDIDHYDAEPATGHDQPGATVRWTRNQHG